MLPTAVLSPSKMPTCSEIRCGGLTMVNACGCKNDVRVVVKVYRTTLEHFAVVYPDKVVCKPIGFINLKNCSVGCLMNSSRTVQIVQKSCDGGLLTFRAESPSEAKKWMEAFQNNKMNRKSLDDALNVSLPILEEEEE